MSASELERRSIKRPAHCSHKRGRSSRAATRGNNANSCGKELTSEDVNTLHAPSDPAVIGDANPRRAVDTRPAERPAAAPMSQEELAWTALSDKKFILACQLSQTYVVDAQKAGTSKKPRLPLPLLHALKDARIPFDRALTMLAISPTHLRAACARAKVELTGEVASSSAESAPLPPLPSAKEPDMAAIQAVLALAPSEKTERPNSSAKSGKPRLSGEALGARIRAIAHEMEVEDGGRSPSYIRIHREHGFAMKTIKKYLPKRSAAARTPVEPSSAVERPIASEASHEMIQVVSEIVFGADLVPGTYVGNDGVVRCDDFTKLDGGLAPLVQKWRQHEGEVARILSTARELTVGQ